MNFTKAARPVMMGRNGMVSSGHALASLAGVRVLQEGGNAVDAALAAAFVMAVVKPEASGPGGDLFALVYMKKTGKVEALNSSGPAPAKASIDYFRERGLNGVPTSGTSASPCPEPSTVVGVTEIRHQGFNSAHGGRAACRARGVSNFSRVCRSRR
jgi:gamma-glutamyltranspeptidase